MRLLVSDPVREWIIRLCVIAIAVAAVAAVFGGDLEALFLIGAPAK